MVSGDLGCLEAQGVNRTDPLQGYLAYKKPPPPLGPTKDPRQGPTGCRFLISEVPLCQVIIHTDVLSLTSNEP